MNGSLSLLLLLLSDAADTGMNTVTNMHAISIKEKINLNMVKPPLTTILFIQVS